MSRLDLRPVKEPGKVKSYWKKEWKVLLLVAVSGLLFDGSMSFVPVLQGRVIDALVSGRGALFAALAFLSAVLIIQGARFIKRYAVRVFANRTSATMRAILYHNLLSKSESALKGETAGELLIKAVSDVDITVEGMRKVTTEVFDTGVLMLSYLIMLLSYDVKLTLAACAFVPVAMWIAERLKSRIECYTKAARAAAGSASETARTAIEHAVLYRINGVTGAQAARYDEKLSDLEKKSVTANIFENSMQPVYYAVSMLGMALIFYFGGQKAVSGNWSVGTFSAYATLFTALAAKASKAAKLFNSYQKAAVSWRRIQPYLAEYPPLPGERVSVPGDTLSVKNLSAAYPGSDRTVLKNVSFSAHSGQIIGVTGPVASGKTTLGLSLCGLVPYTGSTSWGKKELSSFSAEERAGTISYLGHRPELFTGTVSDNVSLGQRGGVQKALESAAFLEDVRSMPEGLETPVGSAGATLSGGQRQRLALARALFSTAPLLILDDPFSALDPGTEKEVLLNLRTFCADRLILLISHRLDLFSTLDSVLLLDETGGGAFGTHDELLEASPLYRRLVAAQEGGGRR